MNPLFGNLGMTTQFQPPAQPSMQLPNYSAAAPKDFGSRFKAALPDILMGIGTSLATNNWGNAGKYAADSRQRREQEGEQAKAQNATVQWLASRGREDLAGLVAQGALPAMQAIQEASKPAPKREMFKAADGKDYWQDDLSPVFQGMQTPAEVKAATEAQEKERKAQLAEEKAKQQAGIVVQDIDRATEMLDGQSMNFLSPLPGSSLTGFQGVQTAKIPGTKAHDFARLMDTIKANAGFDKLQAMRDASPTGGALGQVSNLELGLLQSAIGNLEQSQSEGQLRENLARVKQIYNKIIHGGEAPQQTPDAPASMPDFGSMSDDELRALANGQ